MIDVITMCGVEEEIENRSPCIHKPVIEIGTNFVASGIFVRMVSSQLSMFESMLIAYTFRFIYILRCYARSVLNVI